VREHKNRGGDLDGTQYQALEAVGFVWLGVEGIEPWRQTGDQQGLSDEEDRGLAGDKGETLPVGPGITRVQPAQALEPCNDLRDQG